MRKSLFGLLTAAAFMSFASVVIAADAENQLQNVLLTNVGPAVSVDHGVTDRAHVPIVSHDIQIVVSETAVTTVLLVGELATEASVDVARATQLMPNQVYAITRQTGVGPPVVGVVTEVRQLPRSSTVVANVSPRAPAWESYTCSPHERPV
jgi:hypothetical protein